MLIGSSLGGYLAALYAVGHPEIERVVLLAPAFGFAQLWLAELGPERVGAWQQAGTLPVFHYAAGHSMELSYRFLEDALEHHPFPDVQQPTLIFHGDQDATVPVAQSLAFIEHHPHARLVRLPSGHELTDVLDVIWPEAEKFIFKSNTSATELD